MDVVGSTADDLLQQSVGDGSIAEDNLHQSVDDIPELDSEQTVASVSKFAVHPTDIVQPDNTTTPGPQQQINGFDRYIYI
jgi:hypothetical protein